MKKKMYILVRTELESKYRIVQGSHALASFALNHHKEFKEWDNKTIIYLGVRFEKGIENYCKKLQKKKINLSMFFEPDLRNQVTALACYCDGQLFKKLKVA